MFDSRRLGYASTLCAAKVPEEKMQHFVEVVNGYPGVTHNYRRGHEYNVWFTFIAPMRSPSNGTSRRSAARRASRGRDQHARG